MPSLRVVDFGINHLKGNLPDEICHQLPFLEVLGVVGNQLEGSIPQSIANCTSLKGLYLDINSFTGFIPKDIGNLVKLEILALGENNLSGPIPPNIFNISTLTFLHLSGTNGFDESNLLGSKFWIVYKATLSNEEILVVKVFNLDMEEGSRSFDIECVALRNLRHRNLIKIISSCSNDHFKSLIMEFMENGSLDRWLYSHNYYLDILQRLNIMIDVALALEYLHHDSPTLVVHRDVKPSNVLLDKDMVAHLSDFGISKLFSERQLEIYTKTLATIGYIAP
ncbi:hypothetical protein K1719_040593 [Acacia pycnantha]|nr:hypothetical protein K1719_040593 [Acacia pycnantha]